jgi:hypothetical protein
MRRLHAIAEKLRPYAHALRSYAEKLRPHVDRLRPYAHVLRSYGEKLRPYLQRLRPYAITLRRQAVKALGPIGVLMHSGIVHVGRVSPRTGKKLEAFETWVGQSDGRKLGTAALAAALAFAIGFAAIFPETVGRYLQAISAPGRVAPLPDEIRRAAGGKARQLAAALDARLDKKSKKGKLYGQAWSSAQILVALRESDPDYAGQIDAKLIERYFRSVAGPECACWRRLPNGKYPNHLGITSWVLWTFAEYGIPADKSELEFLLSSQDRQGWWPLFAGATEEKFASSYATAAAVLALHRQSTLDANQALRERLAQAVQHGTNWLKKVADGRARWADYPAWPDAKERREFLGVSGFALFALHRVGAPGLAGLDRDWLRRLPSDVPTALSCEVSGKITQSGKRSDLDDTRYSGLPWGILATVLAYPNGWISGKARAIDWLERALAPGASIHALTGTGEDDSITAEALLALRSHPELARE